MNKYCFVDTGSEGQILVPTSKVEEWFNLGIGPYEDELPQWAKFVDCDTLFGNLPSDGMWLDFIPVVSARLFGRKIPFRDKTLYRFYDTERHLALGPASECGKIEEIMDIKSKPYSYWDLPRDWFFFSYTRLFLDKRGTTYEVITIDPGEFDGMVIKI